MKPNYLVILPTDAAPQFLWELTPLYMTACPKEEIALDFEREQRWMLRYCIPIYFNRDISQELGSQAVTTGLDFRL